jgi:hypothetical protein
VPAVVVEYAGKQVGVPHTLWPDYNWQGRTIEYHRAQIRVLLGFREPTVADSTALTAWLDEQVGMQDRHLGRLTMAFLEKCRSQKIEPPSAARIERLVRSAVHAYDEKLSDSVSQRLPLEIHTKLRALLLPSRVAPEPEAELVPALLQELRADAGPANLETVQQELDKLDRVRALGLPKDLFASISPKVLQAFRQRAAVEALYELRRHPQPLLITLLAAYCHVRGQDLTDTVVDLLVDIVHHIGSKAESRVEEQFLEDLKRVAGKNGLLYRMAEAALDNPRRRDQRSDLPGGWRTETARSSQRVQVHRSGIPQAGSKDHAQFVARALSPLAAALAGHFGIPLQQRNTPARHRRPGVADEAREQQSARLSAAGERSTRRHRSGPLEGRDL